MFISLLHRLGRNRIYIGLFGLVFILTVVQWTSRLFELKVEAKSNGKEKFNTELGSLNSVESLSEYIDSMSTIKGIDRDESESYVKLIDGIIRERFYHGQSQIPFNQNFIAWMFGKFIWDDFSVGVDPDQILRHPNALCSQSAIVFQEIVKEKGFSVRAVGLNRHFCSEVYYEGAWHFMDSDKEPNFDESRSIPSAEELSKDDELKFQAYIKDSENVSIEEINEMFNGNEILFYNQNEFPAKRMYIFQRISKFFSNFLWLLLVIPIILARRK